MLTHLLAAVTASGSLAAPPGAGADARGAAESAPAAELPRLPPLEEFLARDFLAEWRTHAAELPTDGEPNGWSLLSIWLAEEAGAVRGLINGHPALVERGERLARQAGWVDDRLLEALADPEADAEPHVREVAEHLGAALERDEVLALPNGWYSTRWLPGESIIELLWPGTGHLRALAEVQAAFARRLIAVGDGAELVERVRSILSLGRIASAFPDLISYHVAHAVQLNAMLLTREAMEAGILGGEQARSLLAAMDEHRPLPGSFHIEGERLGAYEVLHRLILEGRGDAEPEQAETVLRGLGSGYGFEFPLMERYYDAFAAQLDDPEAADPSLKAELREIEETVEKAGPVPAAMAMGLTLPARQAAVRQGLASAAARRTVRTALRLLVSRAESDSLPPSLETLARRDGLGVPQDVFAEGPLRYEPQPGGSFRVWSVGQDGQDDGGHMDEHQPTKALAARRVIEGLDFQIYAPAEPATVP